MSMLNMRCCQVALAEADAVQQKGSRVGHHFVHTGVLSVFSVTPEAKLDKGIKESTEDLHRD